MPEKTERHQVNWQTVAAISAVLLTAVGYVISVESRVSSSRGDIKGIETRLSGVEKKTDEFYSTVSRLITKEVEQNLKDEAVKKTEKKAEEVFGNIEKIYDDSLKKSEEYKGLVEKYKGDVIKKHGEIIGYHASVSTLHNKAENIVGRIEKESPGTLKGDIENLKNIVGKLSIDCNECKTFTGNCGNGMFNQPTYYFDRVSYSCPTDYPMLKSFSYIRCGKTSTPDEGLAVKAVCCKVKVKSK